MTIDDKHRIHLHAQQLPQGVRNNFIIYILKEN